MIKFVKQNESLLQCYCTAARIIGWVLLGGGSLWFLGYIFWILAAIDAAGEMIWPGANRNILYAISGLLFDFLFPGLVALYIAQFLRFMLNPDYKAGGILRHGHWIFFGGAIALIGQAGLKLTFISDVMKPDAQGLLFVVPLIVPLATKVLIIIGLGVILKRLLPVIEETRTLV